MHPSSNKYHRKQNPKKKKKTKNKGPGNLTDTKNKTHQKKIKNPGSAWKLLGQTDRQTNM